MKYLKKILYYKNFILEEGSLSGDALADRSAREEQRKKIERIKMNFILKSSIKLLI